MRESSQTAGPPVRPAHGAGEAERAAAPICSAAKRWAALWSELDFSRATVLGRARHVKADRYGLPLELIPQLFDLHRGRRFISIGIKYDTGPGKRRPTGSVGFGQFLNLAFADWAIADQLWELLQTGDLGVAFQDLEVIDGGFDRPTKARDRYERDRWVQKVWELKVRLEEVARTHTQQALKRIVRAIRSQPGSTGALLGEGLLLPSSLLHRDPSKEAMTRFRINQGMYGDHTYFIDRPQDGWMRARTIPPGRMFKRARELHRELTEGWLNELERTLDALIAMTAGREGASLARAIESAGVVRKLNDVVSTFWAMWSQPLFSANAEFEVVTDHERRAEKYMEIMVQRSLRILLKQTVEEIGVYPYPSVDRHNYWTKIGSLKEALRRATAILRMYARVDSVSAFNAANREKEKLVWEFHRQLRHQPPEARPRVTASA